MQSLTHRPHPLRGLLITALVFLLLLCVLWVGLAQVDARSAREQAASLEQAVRRSAMLCYAVEGRYPASAAELRTHYGLAYDDSRFIVRLDGFASNLLPDISVIPVGGAQYE